MAAPMDKKRKIDAKEKHIEITDSEPVDCLCYVLTYFPQILKTIFECLPAKTLNNCARVCKIWKETSDRVLKNRFPFYWNYCYDDIDYAKSHGGADPVFHMLCNITRCIKNLPIQPEIAIIFYTTELVERINDYENDAMPVEVTDLAARLSNMDRPKTGGDGSRPRRPTRNYKKGFDIIEWIEKLLPSSCKVTAVTADGVIGTYWDLSKSEERENDCGLSIFCCSHIDDKTSLIPLQLDTQQCFELVCAWNNQTSTYSSNLFPKDSLVKKIMYFTDNHAIPQEFGFALYQEYNQALIAGAIVNTLEFPSLLHDSEYKHDLPSICCVAFCGENVKVASVIIKDSVVEKSEVESCIKDLKSHGLSEKRSVAFMYACVGRGVDHYEEPNVESSLFRKYFPNTPILGIFGNGEIGFRYPEPPSAEPPENNEEDPVIQEFLKDYRSKHPPKLYHAYTTIISLVSFQ